MDCGISCFTNVIYGILSLERDNVRRPTLIVRALRDGGSVVTGGPVLCDEIIS